MAKIRSVGIRGAGLSGMSVARELLRVDPEISITLFDRRPRLPHPQRTFCFFKRDCQERFPGPAVSWKSVLFRGPSFERRVDVSASPYTMIRGDDLFGYLLEQLEARGVSFRWQSSEVDISEHSIRADGETFNFDAVIDAAFEAKEATSTLWQSFAGVWVTSEREVFDPSTAILMDLQESSADAPVSFLYILPTSKHTALVEHTTFSPAPMSKGYHLDHCYAWITERVQGVVQRGEIEHGLIPMGLNNSPGADSIRVGSAAGMVRPATGYAFVATQDHARRVAEQVLTNHAVPADPYPWWLTVADSLFLRALVQSPERGGQLMERLLSRSRSDALISFLAGDVSFKEALSVWMSVPKLSMIRSLTRI